MPVLISICNTNVKIQYKNFEVNPKQWLQKNLQHKMHKWGKKIKGIVPSQQCKLSP